MTNAKYYNMSKLIKISGLRNSELTYLIHKYKIDHKVIRSRKYFIANDIGNILLLAKQLYPNAKNQKTIIDPIYKTDNLIKKFTQIKTMMMTKPRLSFLNPIKNDKSII
jgi:hypothetical protein